MSKKTLNPMFFKKNKINTKMIPNLRPTSKATLKQMCLMSAQGDIDKATKLYEFMIKDMEDLPLFDIQPPSTMEQLKSGVVSTMQWVNENQEQIMNWVGIIKSFMGKGGTPPSVPSAPVNPIPPIN